MKMPLSKEKEIAIYLIRLSKLSKKDINYTLDIVPWYSMTTKQDIKIKKYINSYWNVIN